MKNKDITYDDWLIRVGHWANGEKDFSESELAEARGVSCMHDETLLHYAAVEGMLKEVFFMTRNGWSCNVRNNIGTTPLIDVVRLQEIEMVLCLLEGGADPNFSDKEKNTPLHIAMTIGQENEIIRRLLVREGAKENVKNKYGEVPGQLIY